MWCFLMRATREIIRISCKYFIRSARVMYMLQNIVLIFARVAVARILYTHFEYFMPPLLPDLWLVFIKIQYSRMPRKLRIIESSDRRLFISMLGLWKGARYKKIYPRAHAECGLLCSILTLQIIKIYSYMASSINDVSWLYNLKMQFPSILPI